MDEKPDLAQIKAYTKAAWMAGDYPSFASYLEPGAREMLAGWAIPSGCRLLDVACGAGQVSLPAARAGVKITGVDIATNLIQKAKAQAASEGLTARFDEGDMEDMPYSDAAFDVVVSMLGVMWALRPERVASELLRVCKPGGRIILVNWTPTGLMGQIIERSRAGSPQVTPPPILWGDEKTVRDRLGRGVRELRLERRMYPSLRYPCGPQEVAEIYFRDNGPGRIMFDLLSADQQAAARVGLAQVFRSANRATDGTVLLDAECLEVTAVRA